MGLMCWYQKFTFRISENQFFISENKTQLFIFWYQEFHFLISEMITQIWILDFRKLWFFLHKIKNYFIDIKNYFLISRINFLISRIGIIDINNSFFDIRNTSKIFKRCLIPKALRVAVYWWKMLSKMPNLTHVFKNALQVLLI